MLTSWKFAARLARRDVQRRPGRTLLVTILIAIPIAGMAMGSIVAHTTSDTTDEQFSRRYGPADYAFEGDLSNFDASRFPKGTRILTARNYEFGIRFGHDRPSRFATVTDLDLHDPLARGAVILRSGRLAQRASEAVFTESLAHDWHVNVGDHVRFERPAISFDVVGIGVEPASWSSTRIFAPGFRWKPADRALTGPTGQNGKTGIIRIDVPGVATRNEAMVIVGGLEKLAFGYTDLHTRFSLPTGLKLAGRQLAWGWVAGALALAIVGIIVAAAFATSARRQLVTLGQLGANGAPHKLMRRTLSLQGMWSGIIGSAAGIALAGIVLNLGQHALATNIDRDPGPYDIRVVDLTVIFVTGVLAASFAAWLPARGAARVSVLNALAGNRPTRRVPRQLVPIGFAMFGLGIIVIALVASASRTGGSDPLAAAAVLGGISILIGACCISPAVVATLDRASARLGGAARVAARSLGRARARSAAVVTALAVASAVAIAAGTTVASAYRDRNNIPTVPPNVIVIENRVSISDDVVVDKTVVAANAFDNSKPHFAPTAPAIHNRLSRAIPGIRWSPVRTAVWNPLRRALTKHREPNPAKRTRHKG